MNRVKDEGESITDIEAENKEMVKCAQKEGTKERHE
jgi:hypothetical protein